MYATKRMSWSKKAQPTAVQKCPVVIHKNALVMTNATTRHSRETIRDRTILSFMRTSIVRLSSRFFPYRLCTAHTKKNRALGLLLCGGSREVWKMLLPRVLYLSSADASLESLNVAEFSRL